MVKVVSKILKVFETDRDPDQFISNPVRQPVGGVVTRMRHRRWLFDQDSAVRYWAAVGLLNRGEAVVRQEQGLLTIGMHDGSAYVSTAAAYALGQFGSPQQQRSAVERLVELSRWGADGNVFAALTAANALDKLDGRAAFLKASIEQLPTNGDSPNARYNGYLTNVLKKTLSDLQE